MSTKSSLKDRCVAFKEGSPVVIRLDAVSRPMLPEERDILASIDAEVVEAEDMDQETVKDHADRADAVIVTAKSLKAPVIEKLKRCRVISRMGIGIDKIDVKQASRQGIWVTNLPGFCVEEVADHTMALLLSAARQLKEFETAMRSGFRPQVNPNISIHRLSCCKLGIVGFGHIGKEVARRAKSFKLDILACDPALTEGVAKEYGVQKVELDELLSKSDFVALVCPLTSQTSGMMNAERFQMMKKTAILINTGRGGLINEADLVYALKMGIIRFAALDVFDCVDVLGPGRFPTDHPLFQLENVLMTPHVAAISFEMIYEQRRRGTKTVVDVLCGYRPEHLVNPEVIPWFERDQSVK